MADDLGYDVEKFGPLRQGFDTFEGFVSGNVGYFNKIDQQGVTRTGGSAKNSSTSMATSPT